MADNKQPTGPEEHITPEPSAPDMPSPRWCVPAPRAAMRSSQATAARKPVSSPGMSTCPVSSGT